MTPARLSVIVAVARGGVIGRGNRMPWHLPEDLRHFKTLTMGKPLVMGRKTFQSLGSPLPGRPHVVISRDPALALPQGVHLAPSFEAGIALARSLAEDEVMVIGGAQIFALALPLAERIYLTEIEREYEGDAFFPAFERGQWRQIESERHPGDPAFTFLTLERIAD